MTNYLRETAQEKGQLFRRKSGKCALEDAVALGLALAPPGDVPAALRRYERVRAARTRKLVLRGPRVAAISTTHKPVIRVLRAAALRLAPAGRFTSAFLLAERHDPHAPLRR